MLDLRRLALLHGFATHGTIAATAAVTGYSASAVSQQLAALERDAGVALLERSARSAQLTPMGERLATHAARILEVVEAAETDLATHVAHPVGRVVVATPPSAAVALARGLAQVRSTWPGVEVVVRQASSSVAVAGLRARELDVAVVDDWGDAPAHGRQGLADDLLRRDEVVLVLPAAHPAAHDRAPADQRVLADLLDEPWICAPLGEPSRAAFDRLLGRGDAGPRSRWEFEGLTTIASLVAEGAGLAILPRLAITADVGERIVTRPLSPASSRSLTALTRRAARPRPVLDLVVRAMADAVGGR